MNAVKRFRFLALMILLAQALPSISQGVKLGLVKSEQPVKEAITVIYSNVPALSGKQFYTLFIFGSGGGSYHDSKPLQFLPSGSITLSPLQKPGSFDIVLYKYEDFNDSKPKQVARVPFKAVVGRGESVKLAESKPASNPVKTEPKPIEQKKQEAKPVETAKKVPAPVETKKVVEPRKSPPGKPEPPVSSGAAIIPAITKKEGAVYHLLPMARYNVEEEIQVKYELPALSAGQYYAISVSRPGDTYAINISPEFTTTTGTMILKPIYQEGVYELRVYRGDKNKTQKEEIIFRQPMSIGSIKKDFSGRYNCSTAAPKIFGTPASGAPPVELVVQQITAAIAAQNVEVWLTPDDICLEFFSIQYLSKSNVKVPKQRGSVSYSSFPVKVRYKLAVNDYVKQKASVTESVPDKVFHFYHPTSRTWSFQEVKAN